MRYTRQHFVQLKIEGDPKSIWPVVGKGLTYNQAVNMAEVWAKAGCACRVFTPAKVVRNFRPKQQDNTRNREPIFVRRTTGKGQAG